MDHLQGHGTQLEDLTWPMVSRVAVLLILFDGI